MKKKPVHFDADEINLIKLARDYSDNDKARGLLESLRWPEGPICPHCKATEIYKLTARKKSKAPVRKGVYKCAQCRKQFTVTVGTVFEDSHIQIAVWMQAIFILCSSKKAISAHQLHRMLGITYKSAWFMAHRIRYAMGTGPLAQLLHGTVECDETYVGGKPRPGSGKISKAGRIPIFQLFMKPRHVLCGISMLALLMVSHGIGVLYAILIIIFAITFVRSMRHSKDP